MNDDKLNELYNILTSNREYLLDLVKQDLSCIELDNECSCIYDLIKDEKHEEINFENIVDSVIKRVLIAIESFKSSELKSVDIDEEKIFKCITPFGSWCKKCINYEKCRATKTN